MIYGGDHADAHQFYTISASPTSMNWKAAYLDDVSTKVMLPILQRKDEHQWSTKVLNSIEVKYRSFLTDNHIACSMTSWCAITPYLGTLAILH